MASREKFEHGLVSYFASKSKNFTIVASISLLRDVMRFKKAMEVILVIQYS